MGIPNRCFAVLRKIGTGPIYSVGRNSGDRQSIFLKKKIWPKTGLTIFNAHFALLLVGWIINRWVGMFLFSIPMLGIYYHIAYHMALAVMPASNPTDKSETKNRAIAFITYLWGMQLPFWKAASNTEKNVEKRIDGAPSFNWINSLVWTYSHQVAGIAKGPNFDVKGPGLFFINKNERPFEIVDLRNQTRNSTIKAISRDGIPFEANTHISFCIDHEIWTREGITNCAVPISFKAGNLMRIYKVIFHIHEDA